MSHLPDGVHYKWQASNACCSTPFIPSENSGALNVGQAHFYPQGLVYHLILCLKPRPDFFFFFSANLSCLLNESSELEAISQFYHQIWGVKPALLFIQASHRKAPMRPIPSEWPSFVRVFFSQAKSTSWGGNQDKECLKADSFVQPTEVSIQITGHCTLQIRDPHHAGASCCTHFHPTEVADFTTECKVPCTMMQSVSDTAKCQCFRAQLPA